MIKNGAEFLIGPNDVYGFVSPVLQVTDQRPSVVQGMKNNDLTGS